MTLPNILTLTRLTAAPMLGIMFLYFTRPFADWAALILFVGAALTDWVDGYIARTWKQESKLGTMLDPIADKAMVLIALLVITGIFGLNPLVLLPATLIVCDRHITSAVLPKLRWMPICAIPAVFTDAPSLEIKWI